MPPMARFDEYERCILGYEDLSVYCVVKTSVKPNDALELWGYIKVRFGVRNDFCHEIQLKICLM